MKPIFICLSAGVLIFVLFQKHQQDQRREAYGEKQALIAVTCWEMTRESNRAGFTQNGYDYKYNDLYLIGQAKNVSGKHLRGVVLQTSISDARDSVDGRLLIDVGDMNPGHVYDIDAFVKELYEDDYFRSVSKCTIKDVQVVEN